MSAGREKTKTPGVYKRGDRYTAIWRDNQGRQRSQSATTIGEAPDAEIRLPSTVRVLRPIVSIVPLQFLAYYSALERRANPDIMRTDIPRYRAGLEPLFH